jgi:ribokinase
MQHDIVILGIFVADTAYRAQRLPKIGETILGRDFSLGPGGKGSNQAVAAARAGANVGLITRLGDDAFADMAMKIWHEAGVVAYVTRDPASYTGAAFIFVDENSGDNAIIVAAGAAADISTADVDGLEDRIASARVFVTQLEQPLEAARRGLAIARAGGAVTILNPAPAQKLDGGLLELCDFVTPNETEAEILTGLPVGNPDEARRAAAALRAMGARKVIVTLGAAGALYCSDEQTVLVPAMTAGPVRDTTGAGDAFNGGFATAIARGADPLSAVRFGTAVAAISVTRTGTAAAMPARAEIEALLAANIS